MRKTMLTTSKKILSLTRYKQGLLPMLATVILTGCGGSGFTITGSGGGDCNKATGFEALFSEQCRFENFRNFDRFGPVVEIPATQPSPLPENFRNIDFTSDYLGEQLTLNQFLERTSTTGFLAIVDGKIIDERYYHGNRPGALNAGFSMTKSFVSALVGAAIADGYINNVNEPITQYIPELTSPTFKGVTIKHVLQMSTGVKFNEDYSDSESDINKMSYMVQEMTYIDYMNTLERAHEPGSFNLYASINTHILGVVVAKATGKKLSAYLQEKIWRPMGMEHKAQWMVDAQGNELPMGGLALSLHDWARLGLLYANGGRWGDKQILPAAWVKESVVPDAPHLQPGDNPASGYQFGYQYQWWVPRHPDDDFMALGLWGQTIYVSPKRKVVIVKLSADMNSFSEAVEHAQIEYIQALSRSIAASTNADQ